MSKKLRLLALGLSLVLCVSVFAACGPTTKPDDSDKVTIKIGCWPIKESQPESYALYENYKKGFEEANPNIKIETDEWAFTTDTYMPLAAAGQLPNMYRVPYTEPKKIVESGFALDVTEQLKAQKFDQAVLPEALDLVTKDGKYFGIPYTGYMFGMSYNVSLFKEAGLVDENGLPTYPETYQQLAEYGKKIKDATGKDGFSIATKGGWGGWQFMEIAWSYGVNFMEQGADGKWKATFDSQECIDAFKYLYDLKWKYDILPTNILLERDDITQLYGTNQLAMSFGGDGHIDPKVMAYGIKLEDIGNGPVLAGPKGRYSQFGGDVYMFSLETTPEQVEACLKWVNYIGQGVSADENFKRAFTEDIEAKVKDGYGIRNKSFRIWTNKEKVDFEDSLISKNVNVVKEYDIDLLSGGVQLRAEEPMYAQQLYSLLSDVMQEILQNKNADIPSLVKKANESFQKDFLDKSGL